MQKCWQQNPLPPYTNRLDCNKLDFMASPLSIDTSSALILRQVQRQWLCRGTSPTARVQNIPRLCCSPFHQGETRKTNDLTFPGIYRCWGSGWNQLPLFCTHPPPWSIVLDSTCLLAKVIVRCSWVSCRRQDEGDRRFYWFFQDI